jgi:hypothetical protein
MYISLFLFLCKIIVKNSNIKELDFISFTNCALYDIKIGDCKIQLKITVIIHNHVNF